MWSRRTIAAAAAVAGCATLGPSDVGLHERVAEVLERRGLGADALRVIDNLLEHGAPAPPATPPLVRELLARPLDAADAARIFRTAVPESLRAARPAESQSLEAILRELAEAQRLLREAAEPFGDEALRRELPAGVTTSQRFLAAVKAADEAALRDANLRFAAAVAKLAGLRAEGLEAGAFESSIGKVVIGTRGNDRHGPGAALIIDPGGDDVYERQPAPAGAVSVILDFAGNDEYRGSDVAIGALVALVDLGGDDRYAMDASGLGAAIAGASILIDVAGNDTYRAQHFAQGAAAFGLGILIDQAGDDRYEIEAWGQGLAIAGGIGILWDRGGRDGYVARGVPDVFERGSGLSFAQGVGYGPRGRMGGGIGILRDDGGDDTYQAQMFAQGSGYHYGVGLLWDTDGADGYEAHRYAQGNGTHQAVGVLRDEAGEDTYRADWYAQGMGLDIAVGMLVDGAGADSFVARGGAQGHATANGFGLLLTARGRLTVGEPRYAWGRAEWLRGLPSVGIVLHGERRFDSPPVAVQAPTPLNCPSADAGESLVCRVLSAANVDAAWSELKPMIATPLAGHVAIALAKRPPSNADEIAALLAERESCNVRALALRAWPTPGAAQEGIRSGCFRLQAAARAAFARLGLRPPADARLPSFLRALPPQEDTF